MACNADYQLGNGWKEKLELTMNCAIRGWMTDLLIDLFIVLETEMGDFVEVEFLGRAALEDVQHILKIRHLSFETK